MNDIVNKITAEEFINLAKTEYISEKVGRRSGDVELQIRLGKESIEDKIAKHNQEFASDKERVLSIVDTIVKEQGGWFIFIDDERTISQVTNKLGIFLVAKSYADSLRVMDVPTKELPIKHVYFDYWLGARNYEVTLDAACRLKDSDHLADDFTFSVHSADYSAKDKIAAYLGKDRYTGKN